MGELRIGDKVVEAGGIIFDKDGTLIDFAFTWRKIAETRRRLMVHTLGISDEIAALVLRSCGIDPLDGKIDPRGPLVLASVQDEILIASGVLYRSGYPWDEARQLMEEAFLGTERSLQMEEITKPVPYLRQCLTHLREKGLPLAIATVDGTRQTHRVLEFLKIKDFFDYIVTSEDVSQRKPHPEAIFLISDRLGIPKDKLIMVGDAVTDMKMGKRAGVALTVGILNGVTPGQVLEDWADVVIDSLRQIKVI